jgi:hypothetical protein
MDGLKKGYWPKAGRAGGLLSVLRRPAPSDLEKLTLNEPSKEAACVY